MQMQTTSEKTFSFGDFELSGAKRLLLKQGESVTLNSKTFDLLLALVENHGRVLSKDELLDKVWEGQFVEENNLSVQVFALRKIFGEKKNEHKFIATVPGKGYKFVAEISVPANDLVVWEKSLPVSTREKSETPLIGRTREIAEIKDLLRQDDVNLLTLSGTGGSGKTALAREIAAELEADFADGVFFVELAAATETDFVVSAIANTLGITESGGKSLVETVKDFLRTRQTLVVLDNFEQVLSAAPLVKEFLAEDTQIKILVTSRAALHLNIEREFCVQPLDVPPNTAFSIERLNEFPAIELFKTRAQSVKPNFALRSENIKIVAEICRRLDGLPLAIELAAVRVKLLAPQAILERLEHSLNLLTGGTKNAPERQQTMRDTIRWSYDLLETDEQFLFRRLAIFAGGFSVEAAESVGSWQLAESSKEQSLSDDNRLPTANCQLPTDVLNLLSSLIDSNLLVSKEQTDGNVRLGMLEVVREFALECLEESGEAEIVRRGHSEFFLALAEEAEPNLTGGKSIKWLEKLETEHDNFRAALRWSLEQEPETAARMTAALRQFWTNRSHLTEARSWLEAALEKSDNAPSATRFKLLGAFGLVARNQGDYAATRRASEESLAASRAIKDLRQIILSCHAVAGLETREGNFAGARKLFEESLVISRKLGEEKQIANSLSGLGNLFLAEGNASAAQMPIEESLAISRRLGFKFNVSLDLINLGTVAYYADDTEAAYRHFTESLTMSREMSNKVNISCCLDGLAGVAAKCGNYEQSARLAGAADGLREAIGYKIEPAEEIFRDQYLAITRAALNPQDFTNAYETGRSLNFNEAIALTKVKTFDFSDGSDENISEIIIETHQISRILIEEEVEN